MKRQMTYKAIINHAIGSLGDLSTDLVMFRKELHRIKDKLKSEWTDEEVRALYISLIDLAYKCGTTLDAWEKETSTYIPRPQERGHHGEEES